MGSDERKEKEKSIRKIDIINAAERVFSSKGFINATMDDIAGEAEYTKRTIYFYFSSKEQLFHSIIQKAFSILNSMCQEDQKNLISKNGIGKLKSLGKTMTEFVSRHPDFFAVISHFENQKSEISDDDEIRKSCLAESEKLINLITTLIKEGIRDFSIREDIDVVKTAYIFYANIIGVCSILKNRENYISSASKKNIPDIIEENLNFISRSLKKHKVQDVYGISVIK